MTHRHDLENSPATPQIVQPLYNLLPIRSSIHPAGVFFHCVDNHNFRFITLLVVLSLLQAMQEALILIVAVHRCNLTSNLFNHSVVTTP